MPLDPDIRAFLDAQAALGLPPAWELPLTTLRDGVRAVYAGLAKRPVGAVGDRSIPGPGGALPLRVYHPPGFGQQGVDQQGVDQQGAEAAPPLVVFLHGGGFVTSDLDVYDHVCRRLCAGAGVVVVSVDYRRAPESVFPAAADDAIAATRWCLEQAAALGADPERVLVCGDSAGGNLAAAAAIGLRDLGLQPRLAGQLLIYPVTDLRRSDYPSRRSMAEGYGLSQQRMDWYIGLYTPDPADRAHPHASPMAADPAGLPPTFLMTSGHDPLCSEGQAYAQRLRQAGVEVEELHLEGAHHGVFNAPDDFRATGELWAAMLDWLRRRTAAG